MVKREIVIVMTKLECTYNLNPFRCVGVFVISVCVVFFFCTILHLSTDISSTYLYVLPVSFFASMISKSYPGVI